MGGYVYEHICMYVCMYISYASVIYASSITNICIIFNFEESVKLLYVCSMWVVVACWTVSWLTHTNVFLIFPVGSFDVKNYINASLDARRRDTSIAVIGIANRARIKKLIFCILVIKSMKTAFTVAPSEFSLFYYYSHTTWYCPIDSWIAGLKVARI